MPHPKSITRWQQSVTLEPGFNLEIIRRMSIIASELQERDKLIVLLIDGMALKPTIGFHVKSDFFYGLPNDGVFKVNKENDTANLTNEAITIMARGVGTKYKQKKKTNQFGKSFKSILINKTYLIKNMKRSNVPF
ncbi:uncharacterized protein LOC129733837 isoform X2 [Wyeomyia smithii]|nr:uncharacterized protein LOC129733837 isoform X2 [Wyeomyia smithii]